MTSDPRTTITRTFVVQLTGAPDATGLEGRVEHVVSGRAATFESGPELVARLEELDSRHGGGTPDEPTRTHRSE